VEEAYVYLIKAYLKISPDAWRDPTYTEKAIELAKQFLKEFPNSPYRSEVYSLLLEAKKKLVKHYYLIAKFYEDYGYYYPASVWFEYLILNYPDLIDEHDVLFHYIKNLYLVPRYAEEKISYWRKKYDELKERIAKNEVPDKKAAEKRLQFYKEQMDRWKEISERSVKAADQNLELYKEKYGADKYYKLLLKIKKGEWSQPWIERIL
jgi:outer membrane protein assembly factor BamD